MSVVTRPTSPRTAAEPMAFTVRELTYGALTTLGIMVGLLGITAALGLYVPSLLSLISQPGQAWASANSLVPMLALTVVAATIVGAPVAVVAVLVFAPGAYLIGRLMRRTTSIRRHLVAYATYGLVVGTIVSLLVFSFFPIVETQDLPARLVQAAPTALLTAVAVPAGWRVASRRALRLDSGEWTWVPRAQQNS